MGSNGGYRTLPTKLAAISASALSTAAVLRLFGPSIVGFASSEIPTMYGSLATWLTPPYLYFVVNVIIISIAASSKLQDSPGSDELIGFTAAPVSKQREVLVAEEEVKVGYDVPAEYETAEEERRYGEEKEEEEFVISRSSWSPKRRETVTEKTTEVQTEKMTEYSFLMEKPLVSERLGRRKSFKASPEAGRALGVARSKRGDTLGITWRAITEGRAVPLARHLKKSDTWDATRAPRGNPVPGGPETASSEAQGAAASPTVRKDPSLGREELNRKVEAFIKKFNEEMRKESFKSYLDFS